LKNPRKIWVFFFLPNLSKINTQGFWERRDDWNRSESHRLRKTRLLKLKHIKKGIFGIEIERGAEG
jgi:hypothetical protein